MANSSLPSFGAGKVSAVHDLSDGGLAVALAEMAMASGIGGNVEAEGLEHAFFFGEDQGRYVLTCAARRRRGRSQTRRSASMFRSRASA